MAWPKGKPRKPPSEMPLETVDIDEALAEAADPASAEEGCRFFFGEIGVLDLPGHEKFHVRQHHMFVADPDIASKLIELSKNPNHKIFPSQTS